MVTRGVLLALVCLGTIAGCASVVDPDPGSGTETVTPAPVPSETATSERLAPGVAPVGVVDATALATAHLATFPDGYSVLRRAFVRRGADGYARVRSTFTVADGTFAYRFGTTAESGQPTTLAAGPVATLTLWSDGERVYRRVGYRNGTVRVTVLGPGSVDRTRRLAAAAAGADVEALFESVSTSATRLDGTPTRYRVRGRTVTDVDRFPAKPLDSDPRDVGLLAVLRPDGRVLQYTLTYRARTDDGVPVHRSAHVEFRDPIPSTLDRPEWANATGTDTEQHRPG